MHVPRSFSWWALLAAIGAPAAVFAAPAAAAAGPDVLAPGPWSAQDALERCHAVVETAAADYEGIDAQLTRTPEGLRVDLRSADGFPDARFEAKLCVWSDQDRDRRISIGGEEASVHAFAGPLTWPAGGRDASLTARADASGGACARVWIYASYPDGHRSTKRSSVACVPEAPVAAVPDAAHVALLGVSGGLIVVLGAQVLRRRAQCTATGVPSNL